MGGPGGGGAARGRAGGAVAGAAAAGDDFFVDFVDFGEADGDAAADAPGDPAWPLPGDFLPRPDSLEAVRLATQVLATRVLQAGAAAGPRGPRPPPLLHRPQATHVDVHSPTTPGSLTARLPSGGLGTAWTPPRPPETPEVPAHIPASEVQSYLLSAAIDQLEEDLRASEALVLPPPRHYTPLGERCPWPAPPSPAATSTDSTLREPQRSASPDSQAALSLSGSESRSPLRSAPAALPPHPLIAISPPRPPLVLPPSLPAKQRRRPRTEDDDPSLTLEQKRLRNTEAARRSRDRRRRRAEWLEQRIGELEAENGDLRRDNGELRMMLAAARAGSDGAGSFDVEATWQE